MGEFMQTPAGIILGVGIIVGLAWVFVFRKWGTLGSGTGGVTGTPTPKPNPLGTKQPTGSGTTTKPKPPSELL